MRFTSGLADDEVRKVFRERSDRYRGVPGLIEKLYLHFPETGEFGAVYVWNSREDFLRFRNTELARSIPDAYRIEKARGMELAEVCLVVEPTDELEASAGRSGRSGGAGNSSALARK